MSKFGKIGVYTVTGVLPSDVGMVKTIPSRALHHFQIPEKRNLEISWEGFIMDPVISPEHFTQISRAESLASNQGTSARSDGGLTPENAAVLRALNKAEVSMPCANLPQIDFCGPQSELSAKPFQNPKEFLDALQQIFVNSDGTPNQDLKMSESQLQQYAEHGTGSADSRAAAAIAAHHFDSLKFMAKTDGLASVFNDSLLNSSGDPPDALTLRDVKAANSLYTGEANQIAAERMAILSKDIFHDEVALGVCGVGVVAFTEMPALELIVAPCAGIALGSLINNESHFHADPDLVKRFVTHAQKKLGRWPEINGSTGLEK